MKSKYVHQDDFGYGPQITISSSFMFRARCKKCGSGPKYIWDQIRYYNRRNTKTLYTHFNHIQNRDRLAKKRFYSQSFRNGKLISILGQTITGSAFSPRGFRHNEIYIEDITTVICECQTTYWTTHCLVDSGLEVNHRKGKYSAPTKLILY
jgi:hypothetical protein